MKTLHCLILAAVMGLLAAEAYAEDGLLRIAFGSCNKAELEQPMWEVMLSKKPDLFIWTGDNVYAAENDTEDLREKYRLQKQNQAYRRFKENVPVTGVWDDHDYGLNDGGKFYDYKEASQELFLDFLDVPEDDPRRQRGGNERRRRLRRR